MPNWPRDEARRRYEQGCGLGYSVPCDEANVRAASRIIRKSVIVASMNSLALKFRENCIAGFSDEECTVSKDVETLAQIPALINLISFGPDSFHDR